MALKLLDINEPNTLHAKQKQNDIAIVIDLGTTNSLVAFSEKHKPRILEDNRGRRLIPSTVSIVSKMYKLAIKTLLVTSPQSKP
jgi:molecular chaperone HscA